MSARFWRKGWTWLGIPACLAALAALSAGCGMSSDPPAPGFLPGWDEATEALVSALAAWRDAPSPLPASLSTRSVQFVDNRRRPNQRLRDFQILAHGDVENARQFTVRLNLAGEDSPQLVKYNVLGRDPVWVFRLEDYEMFSHWEHDMDEPPAGPEPSSSGILNTSKNGSGTSRPPG
jgi:hypothetical protein